MSSKENKICKYFELMGIAFSDEIFRENVFASSEKDKLERLAERMLYLFNKIKSDSRLQPSKKQFWKDEFRALEWVFYEFNIIAEGAPKVKL